MTKKDYTGMRSGKLTVIKPVFCDGVEKWECRCDCGNVVYHTRENLRCNKPKSCGCLRSHNLLERRFGRLTVVERLNELHKDGSAYYMCRCDCGNATKVAGFALTMGVTRSCGCLAKDSARQLAGTLAENVKKYHIKEGTNLKNLTMNTPKNNTSGHKGVTWSKDRQLWVAQIKFKGKSRFLGRYKNIEDAIAARERAEQELFAPILDKYKDLKK